MVEQNYEERLEEFYSSLNLELEIYREGKRRWAPFLITDFNVVSEFIRPNENRLSDIIACLLNKNGSHGQGSKFLYAFLKRLFKENQTNPVAELSRDQIQVKREDPTYYNDENQRRRIDITIDFEEIFGIGIENKPWAGEQDEQLADYYNHLQNKYNQQCCLVFITPEGRPPNTIDNHPCLVKKGELYCLSYSSDILEWIEECWQLCKNDKFRWFLCDFREYIRAEFLSYDIMEKNNDESKREIILEHALKNENLKIALDIVSVGSELEIRRQIAKPFQMEISERDIMLNHILKKEKNLEIALDIISVDSDLHQQITNNFREKLQVFLKNKKELTRSQFEWDFHEFGGVTSKSEDLPEVRIWINPNSETDRFIGISSGSFNNSPTRNDLKCKLDKALGEDIDHHDFWIWKAPNWKYKNWTDKDNLIKMHTEEAVKDVGNYFLKIVIKAEPVINEWWVKENAHNG